MNESSRGVGGSVGDPPISGGFPPPHSRGNDGDPPISGGFDPPANPIKEEFPTRDTPPSSTHGQTTDLASLGAFVQDDLGNANNSCR